MVGGQEQRPAARTDLLVEERAERRQIAVETDAIHVLGAEWSYLNRPDRLQVLAERYLDLTPIQPAQISTLQTLPKLDPQSHAVAKLPAAPKAGTAKANVTKVAR